MAEHDGRDRVEKLADAALDGDPVDWIDAESHVSDCERGVVRQLRLVSAIASVHRTAGAEAPQQASPHPPIPLPCSWGPLDVVEHVGRGSFGDVYRAWDRRLDREVALKLLRRDNDDESSVVVSEGRLLARVRHPNVVTIHGADRVDGRVGLWMEFARGRTLEQLLMDRGAFGAPEALVVGVDLCRALSAVHRAGVVHRDIKAQNVVREEGGRTVLMDFGTGRERSLDKDDPHLSGTPLYLAPELFQGRTATRQSDIYSLGVLLFHLVTLSYPVQGRTVNEIRAAHRERRRVWLRDFRPEVPERFVQAIEPALAIDPAARYQSAGEMEQALLTAIPELDRPSADRNDSRAPRTRATARRRSTTMAWMVAGGVTLLIAMGSLSLVVSRLVQTASSKDGSGPPTLPVAAVVGRQDLTARRVSLPETKFVGRPSPDGRYLAYVDLNGDLCLQMLAGAERRCLTQKGQSEEGAESQIAISPDGRWIAYSWHTLDDVNEIRLVGEDGTWPRLLFRRADVAYPNPLQWSSDGTQILTLLELAGGGKELVLLSVGDGTVTPLRRVSAFQPHPALSPDGAFVAFEQPHDGDPRLRDLFVLDVTEPTAPPRAIVEHPADDLFPLWTSDGRLVFVSDRTGSLSVWAMRIEQGRAAGAPELLVRDIGRLVMPLGLTTDGALYYYLENGMVDVFTQALDLSGTSSPGQPQPAAPTLIGSNISSDWSADGRSLAYVSIRGLADNDRFARTLVVSDTNTDARRHLQLPLAFFISPRWSPDGRTILVRGADLQGREGIFAVDVESGGTRPAVIFSPGATQSAVYQWSPDSRAVWYDRSDLRAIVAHDLETGRERVAVDYRNESILRLMQWPGFRVSPDGTSVAYTGFTFEKNVAGTVVRVRTPGGSLELARAVSPERMELQDWTPDGQGVLLIKRNTKERRNMLYEARLDGTSMRPLGVSAEAIRDVSLRRDGRAVTYTAGSRSLEVWVLERFLTGAAAREAER